MYKARHKIRLGAKPGVTGVWQTHGRNEVKDFEKVVKMDKSYIYDDSMPNYIKLVALTAAKIFIRGGDGK